MKLETIVQKYHCTVYTPDIFQPDKDMTFGFCSDLMSDALMIMNTVRDEQILRNAVLITGLTTNQSIRTAEMLDISVVILVRGKIPANQVIELANESNIILIGTDLTMFNLSGALYADGIKGITAKR